MNKWIKIFTPLLLALLVLAPGLSVFAAGDVVEGYSPDFAPQAQGIYLYNIDTGELIYAKNADTPMYPASLTKIMTCILTLEKISDLDGEIATYPMYVQNYLYDYQYIQGHGAVSIADLRANEQLSVRDLLYGMMVPSGNEAAMILADHVSGSQEAFVALMNARARELGALNTHFVNANGLHDEEHVTTPRDMALIAMHAMRLPGFMEIVNATVYECPPTNLFPGGHVWSTTNRMIQPNNTEYFYGPVSGIKTGFLTEAGRCFVSSASKDGFSYILVVMGAPHQDADGKTLVQRMEFVETRQLYEWVFNTFKVKTILDKGKHIGDVELRLNLEQDRLRLKAGGTVTALLPKDIEASSVTFVYDIPEFVEAPVKRDDPIGEVTLLLSGKEIGRVPLLAAESVEASQALILIEQTKEIMRSYWFKVAVVLVALLILFVIALRILRARGRKRSGYQPRRRI